MGITTHYVGRKQQYRSLVDNLASTAYAYLSANGFFDQKANPGA